MSDRTSGTRGLLLEELITRTLADVGHAAEAAKVIGMALALAGAKNVPGDDALVGFVEGPLRLAARQFLDPSAASALAERLERVLEPLRRRRADRTTAIPNVRRGGPG